MKQLGRLILVAAMAAASMSAASACTTMIYTDTSGRAYQGRTNEFVGALPDTLTYFPAGTSFQSFGPAGQAGVAYAASHAILAVTLSGMVPGSDQPTLHEAMNDQGLTFTTNSLDGNVSPDVAGSPAGKLLSATDLGTWALSQFATVKEVKQALDGGAVAVWLPKIPALGPHDMPTHFAMFDRTGAGIVIEWTDGKTTVYDNPVGVMTNDPPFPWHLQNLNFYAYLTNLDKNSGQFGKLKVAAPDSGGNMSGLPGNETSVGRFVKAAYYSHFAEKAATPREAILTLGHVMNNFDRPRNISLDSPEDPPGGERDMKAAGKPVDYSEVTEFTVLKDLSQNLFYIRTIESLNFAAFDLNRLAVLKDVTTVSFKTLEANDGVDGTALFLK